MDMVERKISDKLRPDAILPGGSPNPKYLTPPSMVEAVARAIYTQRVVRRNSGENWAYPEPAVAWEDLNERSKDLYREEARAAIAAMRDEITREMELAGLAALDEAYGVLAPHQVVASLHQAMIDAALGEVE